MVKVTHRNLQKLPAGIETPIEVRKCESCDQIFMSEQGLAKHQSLKKNVNCFRAGLHRKRKNATEGNECSTLSTLDDVL